MSKKQPVATIKVDVNRTAAIKEALQRLKKTAVYIGIPADSDADKRKKCTVTNSDLGYIHEFGSETAGIPPRPFLKPGVESAKGDLKAQMRAAAKAALQKDDSRMDAHLQEAADKGRDAVKNYLRTADLEPIKVSTAANRWRDRQTADLRKGELDATETGSTSGLRPLINTGQLLNSITGVVVEEE